MQEKNFRQEWQASIVPEGRKGVNQIAHTLCVAGITDERQVVVRWCAFGMDGWHSHMPRCDYVIECTNSHLGSVQRR